MAKLKKAILVLIAVLILAFISAGTVIPVIASADVSNGETEQITTVDPDISPDNGLITQFTQYLKALYGEEYEFYYNRIIETWGSVEAYLTSLGEKLPDKQKTAWDKFVGWLGEYSVIWAPALACIIVFTVVAVGKKQFNRLVERIVNSKLSPIVTELNLQSNAAVAMLRAQKALLGNNEKFSDKAEELTIAEKELKNE